MNREDIIRMAQEAGGGPTPPDFLIPVFERFAALVASAERERLTDAAMKAAEKAVDVAIALEREACLKFCDEVAEYFPSSGFVGSFIGSKIRSRGQA